MDDVHTGLAGRKDGDAVWRKMGRAWRNVVKERRVAVETRSPGCELRARHE